MSNLSYNVTVLETQHNCVKAKSEEKIFFSFPPLASLSETICLLTGKKAI